MNEEERFRRFALGLIASDPELDVVQLYVRFARQYAFPPDAVDDTDEALRIHNASFIGFAAKAGVPVERCPYGWQKVRSAGVA